MQSKVHAKTRVRQVDSQKVLVIHANKHKATPHRQERSYIYIFILGQYHDAMMQCKTLLKLEGDDACACEQGQ